MPPQHHPSMVLRNKKMHEDIFSVASFLVSTSHETSAKENRWFRGGIVESAITLKSIYTKLGAKQNFHALWCAFCVPPLPPRVYSSSADASVYVPNPPPAAEPSPNPTPASAGLISPFGVASSPSMAVLFGSCSPLLALVVPRFMSICGERSFLRIT